MSSRILVSPRSLTRAGLDNIRELDPLRNAGFDLVSTSPGRQPDIAELHELVPDCVGWIAGVEPITADVIASANQLRVISRYGTGTDAIDIDAAQAQGIAVERALGGNARGVAELALAQMLNLLRFVVPSSTSLLAGEWERPMGRELGECTIGIVGYGAIGKLVEQFAGPLADEVLVHEPLLERTSSLDDLLASSDVITLHCPPPDDGSILIGSREIALMKPGSVLVNTARGALVDPDAMLSALESGHIAGYAVDAFEIEPPALTALLSHPSVIPTPHIGAQTQASVRRTTAAAVENLLKHLEET